MLNRRFLGVGAISFCMVGALVGGILWLKNLPPQVLGIVSPLSEDFTRQRNLLKTVQEKKSLDEIPTENYFPKNIEPRFTADIEINAQGFAVMERTSGELLFGKNLHAELPIASVTKIMTSLIAIEYADPQLELTVSDQAAKIGEAVMGLTAGEKVRVNDLLYGLMLPSGNDAAETLAEGLQGGRSNYLVMMNQKAQSLGMFDSFFFNPTGLDGDTREVTSFSTAWDLLALTNYALKNPRFADLVDTHYKEIPYAEGKHKAFYLSNILQLDRSYPGIKGVKPGITDFAGETLVSYAENGGKQVIIVLLGTEHSRDETIKIYDMVFKKLGVAVHAY